MAISRMQQPRQQYGIGKLVKKAFKGVKKIAKSPLGKAAILGGLGMYGMGAGPFAGGGVKGAGFLKNIGWLKGALAKGTQLGPQTTKAGWLRNLGGFANKWLNPWQSGKFSGKHAFGLGAAGLIAAPFIQKKLGWGQYQDDEEVPEDPWSITPGNITNIISQARMRDPSLNFLPSSNYAQSGFYAADGGRAGLLNGGEAGEAQMEQMLRAEYIKYRNQGGTMPYEQFKILVTKQAQQGQMPNQMMAADGGRAGYRFGREVEQERGFIEGPQGDEEFDETLMASDPNPQDEAYQMYLNALEKGEFDGTFEDFLEVLPDLIGQMTGGGDTQFAAQGGRIGYANGDMVAQQTDLIEGPQGGEEFQETVVEGQEQPSREQLEALAMEIFQTPLDDLDEQQLLVVYQEAMQGQPMEEAVQEEDVQYAANGGRMGFQYGGSDDDDDILNQRKAMSMYRTRRQEGGLMDLGGQEKDYRDEGGFVAQ